MDKSILPSLENYLHNAAGYNPAVPEREPSSYCAQVLPYPLLIETVAQVPIGISITDKKANILYVNAEFSRITGYHSREILGKNESMLSDKNTPRQVYQDLWRTIGHKKIWHGQLINRHKAGHRYLAEITIAPMLDGDDKISHFIGMLRDVSTEYQTEQQVKNQKLLIESVVNLLPVAVAVIDEQDKVVLDNHLYKALVSELDKKEPALFFLDLLRAQMSEKTWQECQKNLQSFSHYEFKVERKNKPPRWFSCSGSWFSETVGQADAFFSQQQQSFLILTLTDITRQRKQLEELHLQSLKLMMAEDAQVRSIRETLLGAMHQIQVPMNQIHAAEQILQLKHDEAQQPLLKILQQIQQSGQQAIDTMRKNIPALAQSTQTALNLNQILHEVLLISEPLLQNYTIRVDWQPLNQLPSILGAENKLRILFKQLLDNAIEAMREQPEKDMELKIITYCDNDWVYACISDSGPGIPPDKRSQVFEPFYTTRQDTHQAGMGLVIVKEILDRHQGMIEIDGDYQDGCRFKLSFPRYKNRWEADR